MSNNLIRETAMDKIIQVSIDLGKISSEIGANIDPVSGIINPLGLCKIVFEMVEKSNVDNFITAVLTDKKLADIKSIDSVKPLKRLYRATQAIHKATTQEKINRFKKLTVNGILNQDSLSDDNFELFVNIIDELTDTEFIMLTKIYHIEQEHKGERFNAKQDEIENKILKELEMNKGMFVSYVHRLKSKGLIVEAHGFFMNYNTPFYVSMVNGKISEMAEKLIEFIHGKDTKTLS